MPFATINGLNICFDRAGKGAPLLFIGGTGWDLRQHPNPMDSRLASEFDLLHYDQRGMGRSSKPPGPWSMQDFASDAAELITATGWKHAHVIGYSFGGMVAQELAINWPQLVDRLVLAATTAGGDGGSSYPIEEFLEFDPLTRAQAGIEVADLRFTKQWQQQYPEQARLMIEARAVRQTEYQDEPGMRAGLREQLRARSTHNAYDRLHLIQAHTLVLAGSHDGQAPIAAQRKMASRIKCCDFVELPSAHNFIFETDRAYVEMARFCECR